MLLFQARIDEDLILYEAFPYAHLPDDRLKLRFHRVPCNALLRTKKSSAKKNAAKKQKDAAVQSQQNAAKSTTNAQEVVTRVSRTYASSRRISVFASRLDLARSDRSAR